MNYNKQYSRSKNKKKTNFLNDRHIVWDLNIKEKLPTNQNISLPKLRVELSFLHKLSKPWNSFQERIVFGLGKESISSRWIHECGVEPWKSGWVQKKFIPADQLMPR